MNSENTLNPRLPVLWHGGDYNPEQWPRETWDEDVRLMQIANFRVATLGVFSWAKLEPAEDHHDFGWLDEVIERLSTGDRYFILATPSAAPPAWMARKYPEILRTGPDRMRRLHGNRVNYSLSSPIYRQKCQEISKQLATRYGGHPRLLAWHVSNEYGGADYSPLSIDAFRTWLKEKYGTLEALNAAYWTTFWSHTYFDWAEIDAPGAPYGETAIQGLTVDWQRFVTDQTVEFMLNEAAPLREISPEVPLTTNFMGTFPGLNYRRFSQHIDFACWDSYPAFAGALEDKGTWIAAAFKHDLTRCLAPNRRWMLMECSPSSSNWYKKMGLKKPGMHGFEALQPIAHGADGVQYFQWRQCRGGQEQFHGGVVNHGTKEEGRVFQEVKEFGEELARWPDIAGSRYDAEVAILFDWESMWALDAACGPVQGGKGYEETCIEHYRPFWITGIPVDVVGQDADFSRYKLVIAPMAYSLQAGFAERITEYVRGGGTFVTTYLSGWTDENSLVFENGFLGPLGDVLGIWSEELDAKAESEKNRNLISLAGMEGEYQAGTFCELIYTTTAETVGTYRDDFYAGRPSLTLNQFGSGQAYYIASRNESAFTEAFLNLVARELAIQPVMPYLPKGVTAQRRVSDTKEWIFLMNATQEDQFVFTPDGRQVELAPWGTFIYSGDLLG